MRRDAVLLVAHGTATSPTDIPEFLLKIRRGRPPSDALVKETVRRYDLIGGSPLLRITEAQAAALQRTLGLPVAVAMRLWHPLVEEALPRLLRVGIGRVCVLPLAPYSVGLYHQAVVAAAGELANELELVSVGPWGTEPALIRAHASAIERAGEVDATIVTAHSLPLAVLARGDRYAIEFEACVAAVARQLGREVVCAYQSQNDEGEWLGPDLRTVMERVREQGARRVALAPVGFLADHVETLYDLDLEARAWADELELDLVRVPALNDAPGLIDALASVAQRALGT